MQKEMRKDPTRAIEVSVFQRGQQVISEGEESPFFYVILTGKVVLSKSGKRIRTLGELDIFGLECLMLKKHLHYAVEAAQECRIARYGSETLEYLIHESPRMIQNVLISILHQLDQTESNLLEDQQRLPADRERMLFYKDGEVIMEDTSFGTDFYRLVSTQGGVQVTVEGRQVERIIKPGEFFGFSVSCRDACLRSIGESVVEKYGADDLDILIRDYPESASRIMRSMIERLQTEDGRQGLVTKEKL